ncbi:reverse transcriptase domain-containing protein [Tanacetum coccineum]
MRTRSSSNLIVESSTIPKRCNRRRSKQIVEPEIRTIVDTPIVTMADTRTMSELLQAPTEGYGDAIVIPTILAKKIKLKVGLLQLVTSSQFHGFERDDPHAHICWFNKITSTLKYKNVPHDAIKLMLFPFSLEGAARIWLEKEPPRSILTCEDLVSKFVNYFFPHSRTTNLKNDITNFQQKFEETFSEAWDRFKELLRKCPHHNTGGNTYETVLPRDALTIIENKSKVRTSRNKPIVSKVSTTTSSSSPSPDVTALTEIVKELVLMNKANPTSFRESHRRDLSTGTYNQGGNGYHPQGDPDYRASNQMGSSGSPPKSKQLKLQFPSGSGSLPSNTVANPRGDVKAFTTRSGVAYDGPTIPPTPSPFLKEVERETEFTSTFKSLRSNKEKLFELESTLLNENCSAVLLKKLPEKLGDPGKFLIPCDFSELDECLALADLGASINLMPLSVWKKFSLPELTPTRMTLELANRSVAYPKGVAEDVFVKVGKFHFPANFVVVDYDVDHRVPLILGRPFLRMARALIDVHGEELTLRVNDEAITFKVGHTSRYFRNNYDETVHQFDVIDIACEEYAQESRSRF